MHETQEIRRLNTLRGIAALMVVVSHYSNLTGIFGAALGNGGGQFGVMIFFVLSGFLMSYLYVEREFDRRQVGAYARARIARVLPLYVTVVLVSYLSQRLAPNGIAYPIDDAGRLVSHLLFLEGTFLLWTIPVELQFYVVFVLLWLANARAPRLLLFLCALLIVAPGLLGYPEGRGRLGVFFTYEWLLPAALPYFAVGVLLGKLQHRRPRALRCQSPWFALALPLVLLLYPTIYFTLFGREHGTWEDPFVLAAVASLLFAYVVLVPESPLVANRAGDFLGRISYSLYLLHLPLLTWMEPWIARDASAPWKFGVFLALALAVSSLSYRLIEAPSRRALRGSLPPRRL